MASQSLGSVSLCAFIEALILALLGSKLL